MRPWDCKAGFSGAQTARPCSGRFVGHRRHLYEGVVQTAAAAPVGRFLGGEHVYGAPGAAGIDESAERHPGHARSNAVREGAYGSHLAAIVPHADRIAARHAPRPRVIGVDLDEELARAATVRI